MGRELCPGLKQQRKTSTHGCRIMDPDYHLFEVAEEAKLYEKTTFTSIQIQNLHYP